MLEAVGLEGERILDSLSKTTTFGTAARVGKRRNYVHAKFGGCSCPRSRVVIAVTAAALAVVCLTLQRYDEMSKSEMRVFAKCSAAFDPLHTSAASARAYLPWPRVTRMLQPLFVAAMQRACAN